MLFLSHLYKSSIPFWFRTKDLSSRQSNTITVILNLRSFASTDETTSQSVSNCTAWLLLCGSSKAQNHSLEAPPHQGLWKKRLTHTQTPIPLNFKIQKTKKDANGAGNRKILFMIIWSNTLSLAEKPTIKIQKESYIDSFVYFRCRIVKKIIFFLNKYL